MGNKCAGFFLILAALVACAGPSGTLPSVSIPAGGYLPRHLGMLHVEPYEIVFTSGSSRSMTIRVWQSGWHERYKMENGCGLVAVKLVHYAHRNVSLWQATRVGRHGKERCRVDFSGSRGPRGKNYVEIRVLQRS